MEAAHAAVRGEPFALCCALAPPPLTPAEKPSQNSENEQNSVSLEVLLVKVCHKKRKVSLIKGVFHPKTGIKRCVRKIALKPFYLGCSAGSCLVLEMSGIEISGFS